jgi:hypothetical protein|tara:strand:- start:101 stop:751 length:651 start_codon:yes stop_codon:yes gene_type:complete
MSYFRELPNIFYQSQSKDRNSSNDYVLIKNIFRRTKLRDDLQNVVTIFNKYQISPGERPDTIADYLYGDPGLDWVVMMTANIINIRDQWPLSDKELYKYAENKYGTKLNDVRFHETTEVKDSLGRLILPKGKIVDSDFTIPKPDANTATLNPVAAVSNYDYEVRENDKKRQIFVLKQEYLGMFLEDMRNAMKYDQSSEYINSRVSATRNTRNTSAE